MNNCAGIRTVETNDLDKVWLIEMPTSMIKKLDKCAQPQFWQKTGYNLLEVKSERKTTKPRKLTKIKGVFELTYKEKSSQNSTYLAINEH